MLKDLMHKYWLGETNREEEQLLRNLLNQEGVSGEAARLKALFAYYDQEKSIKRTHPLTPEVINPPKIRSLRTYLIGIAASLVLAVGIYLGWNYVQSEPGSHQTALYADTYDDPDLAYQETKKALQMISQKMNQGKDRSEKKIKKVSRLTIFVGAKDN